MSLLVAGHSFISFSINSSLETAATLTYYGFLSLMPLLLLVMFLLGHVLKSSEAILSGMQAMMSDLFPAFSEEILKDLMNLAQQQVWGIVGLVVLVWSMTPFASAIRSALFRIFKSDRMINIFLGKLLDVTAVLALLLLFVAMVVGKIYLMANASGGVFFEGVVPFAVTTLVMMLFFAVLSPVRLSLPNLCTGAVTTAILLSAIRPVFGMILQYNPNFGYAFGSLKAMFILLVWVYYTFSVILFGAEVMANARRKDALLLRGLFLNSTGGAKAPSRLLGRFVRQFNEGDTLFREGDEGREMFYVLTGSVSLAKGETVLWVVKAGEYFGEMSMLTKEPRSATATIHEPDTQLIAISEDNFETIMRENPRIVQSLLKEMALRLKETSDRFK